MFEGGLALLLAHALRIQLLKSCVIVNTALFNDRNGNLCSSIMSWSDWQMIAVNVYAAIIKNAMQEGLKSRGIALILSIR